MIRLTYQLGTEPVPRTVAGIILRLGRAAFNHVKLEDRRVSRHHARIEDLGGQVLVVDLSSGNGIRVNGEKVAGHSLMTGDRLGIGPFELTVLNIDSRT
jgi:pSer/pThr/pTyr-binding forkhead associated (FHA) protein